MTPIPLNRPSTIEGVREALAQQQAEELIVSLGINEPSEIDIEDIAMICGALVVEGGLSGAEARLTSSKRLSFIRLNPTIREPGRRRFAIAHEVGHLLLHKEQSPLAVCRHQNLVLFQSSDLKEVEANIFAAALLMPRRIFQPQCHTSSPSSALIRQLSNQFQVTLTAAGVRFIEFCPHRCCLVVSTNGQIRYHRRTTDFGYFIKPSEELSPLTYAADFFAGKQVAPGMHPVPATAWLEGRKLDNSKRILEDSIPMPSYDSVLTILWIDTDIDQYVTDDDEQGAEQEASDSHWSWNRYKRRQE